MDSYWAVVCRQEMLAVWGLSSWEGPVLLPGVFILHSALRSRASESTRTFWKDLTSGIIFDFFKMSFKFYFLRLSLPARLLIVKTHFKHNLFWQILRLYQNILTLMYKFIYKICNYGKSQMKWKYCNKIYTFFHRLNSSFKIKMH